MTTDARPDRIARIPFWALVQRYGPALVAITVIAVIYTVIARDSGLGAAALLPVMIGTLAILRFTATWRGHQALERRLAIILLGALTVAEALVTALTMRDIFDTSTRLVDLSPAAAQAFLGDAVLTWVMNILVFSFWYWDLDGDGPLQRHLRGYQADDLRFPQSGAPTPPGATPWQPRYVDYLFVAFTTSTAFGPSDTNVLSVRAKLLTMVQTLISMALILVVVSWSISAL